MLEGETPKSWVRNKMCLIPKSEDEWTECSNMRPITMNEFSDKVFGGIVKEKLWKYLCDNRLVS